MIDGLELIGRWSARPGAQRHYSPDDKVPLDGVVPAAWRDPVVDELGRVAQVPYELCVLRALREAIRRREVWVVGAHRWGTSAEVDRHYVDTYGASIVGFAFPICSVSPFSPG